MRPNPDDKFVYDFGLTVKPPSTLPDADISALRGELVLKIYQSTSCTIQEALQYADAVPAERLGDMLKEMS